jgi:hypothetical protein
MNRITKCLKNANTEVMFRTNKNIKGLDIYIKIDQIYTIILEFISYSA